MSLRDQRPRVAVSLKAKEPTLPVDLESFIDLMFIDAQEVIARAFRLRGLEEGDALGEVFVRVKPRMMKAFAGLSARQVSARLPSDDRRQAYLFRCADRVAKDVLRERRRGPRVVTRADLADCPEEADRIVDGVAGDDPWARAEEAEEAAARAAEIEASSAFLKDVTRPQGWKTLHRNTAVLLSYLKVGNTATAQAFGISESRVSQIVGDIKRKFGDAVELAALAAREAGGEEMELVSVLALESAVNP